MSVFGHSFIFYLIGENMRLTTHLDVEASQPEISREIVRLNSCAEISFRNVAWIIAHLTARMKCIMKDGQGERILETNGQQTVTFSQAIHLVNSDGNVNEINIQHVADNTLGGISFKRIGSEQWLVKPIPAIETIRDVKRLSINFIAKELFLSAKYATTVDNPGTLDQLITYMQPLYFHPKFSNEQFDPTYFTVE